MGQFSVRRLMALVLVSSLVFVALTKPTPLGIRLAFSAGLLAALVATIGALVGRGPIRVRCVGFSTLAGAYLILSLGPWCDTNVAPHLASTALIDRTYTHLQIVPEIAMVGSSIIYRRVRPAEQGVEGQMTEVPRDLRLASPGIPIGSQAIAPPGRSREDYRRLGHSLMALLIGTVGALVGTKFARTTGEAGLESRIDP